MIPINYLFARWMGVHVLDINLEYHNIIVFRALIGYFGLQGLWASMEYVPITISNCIFQTMPVWTGLLTYFYLKERITWLDVVSIITSFTGVIIINNPFEQIEGQQLQKRNMLIGSLFAFSGAIFGSFANLCMRVMTKIHYTLSPFWFACGSTFWSAIIFSV